MIDEEMDFTDARLLRKKAEKALVEKKKEARIPETETDEKRLLHELQVHRIELEMQNEELRQSYETAEAALKKYTMLYDFAPMGYFTLDSNGTICDLNFTGAEILRDKRVSLINSNFKLYVSEKAKLVFYDFFNKIYTNNTKESCTLMLGYNNTPLCTVYMEGILTGDEGKCLVSMLDISSFKNQNNS